VAVDIGGGLVEGQVNVCPAALRRILPRVAGRACRVGADQLKQWWLTVPVPENTPAGQYRMRLTVRPANAPPSVLEWRLLVLPFRLSRPADKHWGTWLDHFPPVGGLSGPERRGRNVPAETDRLARADMRDFREHGFDLVLLNYYLRATENPDGSFSYDLRTLPHDLEYLKLLGSSAPVVITCEYAFRDLEYGFAEPGVKHVPGTFSPKAHRAIVGLVRYFRDEASRHHWPKLYFAPIDEPGNSKTENRMLFAENVLDFVHEVPGCQTAVTIDASDLQRLGERVDVRIYGYGALNRRKALQDARQGHPFWYYENGMFYGRSTLASRGYAGFEFLRSGAEVSTAWGFAATYGNPHNDFDGGHRDWNVLFPGVDRLTPTIYWELCREGVDDCRYVATLQQEIRRARGHGRAAAATRAEQVLAPLIDPEAPPTEDPLYFGRYRWRIAREILNLLGNRQGEYAASPLSFPAVADNRVAADQTGPNLVRNPSFEDAPETGGLPGGLPGGDYVVTDPYTTPEGKPAGALAVTDEIAHSGRQALKWDLSKAAGEGVTSGRYRYLVVNVRIPPEVANSLRGKRVKVGYWFRLGGGAVVPGMWLRQMAKNENPATFEYHGGGDDAAVWSCFQAEGRMRTDYDALDIHTFCRVPEDPALAKQAFFYTDDVFLQAIEEPPLTISTPLDEYYVGEAIAWNASALSASGQVQVALLSGGRVVAQQARPAQPGPVRGAFETHGLRPGIVTLQATLKGPPGAAPTARRQVIVAPDPFDRPTKR
jgi:hypothetical protein